MPKTFLDLRLNNNAIEGCLLAYGVADLRPKEVNQTHMQWFGKFGEKDILLNIYTKPKGTTIGYANGKCRELFEALAEEIVRVCSLAGAPSVNTSIPFISEENRGHLVDYLLSTGAEYTFQPDTNAIRTLYRLTGSKTDKIVLTHYTNGRLQIQGVNLHLARDAFEFLRELLTEDEILAMDISSFSLPTSIQEAKEQLAALQPNSHDWLNEEVRKQLSSAHVLTQTRLPLEDFMCVAFPALRGLEGFIKQVYVEVGAVPDENTPIGEWFSRSGTHLPFKLKAIVAQHVGAKKTTILEAGYNLYHSQRHSAFHMAYDTASSRILDSLEDAKKIVDDVLDFIDRSCATMRG